MLSLVILSSFVLVCLGKTESSLQGIVDSKALAIQQLQHTLGVDITQIQVVRRHGQLSQATNGWAYVRLHSFGDCSGDDFMSLGLATGVCLADQPDVNGQVTTSYVYSCTDSRWAQDVYANSNCNPDGFQQTNLINVTAPGVCGPYPPSTPVDDVENIYNGIYTCTTSQSLDLGSNYVMTKYYDSTSCGQMGSFSGSRDGGCFPFELTHEDDDGFLANYTFASLLTSYPKEYYFLEANCSQDMLIGDDRLPPLVHSCTISNDDDDDAGDDDDVFESTSWISYKSSLTCTLPQTTDCSPIGDDDLTDSDYAVAAVGAAAGVVVIGIGIFFMSKAGYFGVSMHHATNQPRTPDLDISSEL